MLLDAFTSRRFPGNPVAVMLLERGRGGHSCVRTGEKAGQRYQKSDGEAHRISLEHLSTPDNW